MSIFIELEKSEPEHDLGPELGIFDGYGMLAASYRQRGKVWHVWVYMRDSAGIDKFLILDREDRARALCDHIAERRGGSLQQDPPPDIDEMWRGLTS